MSSENFSPDPTKIPFDPARSENPEPSDDSLQGLTESSPELTRVPEITLPITESHPQLQALSPLLVNAETLCPPLPDGRVPNIPGYTLLGLLGTGSYGQVYKAQDLRSGKIVAIKFFLRGTDEKWQALIEEVRQHAQLDSVPGIIDLKLVVPDHDPPYYVMAFADQGSLADRLLLKQPFTVREGIRLFRQIASALAYVHAKGICHCDLKPGNVLLDIRGRVMLADFGQAQPASKGHPSLGTLYFMPPEQATAFNTLPDPSWDVYALGALVYTLLTGKPPRQDEAIHLELHQIPYIPDRLARYKAWLTKAPAPVNHRGVKGVDSHFAKIIERCLELNPRHRYRNASEILAALDARAQTRRRRPLLIFGVLTSLVLIFITALTGTRSKNEAIDRFRHDLTAQLLDSNQTSAELIAKTVERQLKVRINRIVSKATNPSSVAALADAIKTPNRLALEKILNSLMRSNENQPSTLFAETTVTNARGELLAMVQLHNKELSGGLPPVLSLVSVDPTTLPRIYDHFSWRDWFSGKGDRYDETTIHHPPIRKPHLSNPYVSALDPQGLFISISAPIYDPENANAKPIGVLEAAISMSQMGSWLTQTSIAGDGFTALLDKRRHFVQHPLKEHLPQRGQPAMQFFSPEQTDRLFAYGRGTLSDYRDPLDGKIYLVGYAHTDDKSLDWIVLVQHERSRILRPIKELSDQLSIIGWQSFLTTSVLVGGLWGWLYWSIRRMEIPIES